MNPRLVAAAPERIAGAAVLSGLEVELGTQDDAAAIEGGGVLAESGADLTV